MIQYMIKHLPMRTAAPHGTDVPPAPWPTWPPGADTPTYDLDASTDGSDATPESRVPILGPSRPGILGRSQHPESTDESTLEPIQKPSHKSRKRTTRQRRPGVKLDVVTLGGLDVSVRYAPA